LIQIKIIPMHLFVYLHGFKSSPLSNKAQLTKAAIETRIQLGEQITWYCPQLPASPRAAIAMVREHIDGQTFSHLSLMGSSLGGYYATHLGELFPSKVSLLNPAIEPARDLEASRRSVPFLARVHPRASRYLCQKYQPGRTLFFIGCKGG
jgi:predicted esterase YcpF (UPF0227 family)